MKKFGCTAPFIKNQDHVCQNESIRVLKEVSNVYFEKLLHTNNCLKNCKYMSLVATERYSYESYETNRLMLRFDKYVEVIKSYVSYSGLELLAELGGYAGLFLGLSVFETHRIVEYLCYILYKLFKK